MQTYHDVRGIARVHVSATTIEEALWGYIFKDHVTDLKKQAVEPDGLASKAIGYGTVQNMRRHRVW